MNGWSVLIAAHASGAMLALLLGTVMLVRGKGDRVHRRIGRIWMVDMYWVVLSSFGITRLNHGHLSWIHGLSAWTFVSLTMAWRAARMGDVRKHRGWAIGSYGGLLGAFAGAVAVPVRLIPRTVVHQPLIALVAVGLVGLVGYLLVKASGMGASCRSYRATEAASGGSRHGFAEPPLSLVPGRTSTGANIPQAVAEGEQGSELFLDEKGMLCSVGSPTSATEADHRLVKGLRT